MMIKVLEKFSIQEHIILVCNLFDLTEATKTLWTNVGTFNESQFYIEPLHACFSEPNARYIVIKTTRDCSELTEIQFV